MVATIIGSGIALLLLLHTAINARLLRRPHSPEVIDQRVAVLVPCRNEAGNVGPLIASLEAQQLLSDVEILILDDNSSDGTYELALQAAGAQTRVLRGAELPDGWLGKPYACHQLAEQVPHADVLVFIDADVRLAPTAVAQAVATLRLTGLSLVSPYPRQVAATWSERLLQPLLQWSWLATLPLRIAEHSTKTSLTAANGQFIVVDANAYRSSGGHRAIAQSVLDDIDLLKALKSQGHRGVVIDGTTLAQCRMYTNWSEVQSGYTKWLWAAFGSIPASLVVVAMLATAYLLPLISMVWFGLTWVAVLAYCAGVLSRIIAAARTQGRLIDTFFHPISVALLIYLIALSWWRHYRKSATWKGRVLTS